MKINTDKTKVMIFNPSRIYDGTPKLTLSDMGGGGEYLEVVEKFKLLGVIIRSDLKWRDNTNYICQNGLCQAMGVEKVEGAGDWCLGNG